MSGTFVCVNVGESFSGQQNYHRHVLIISHLVDVISSGPGKVPFLTKPVAFDFHFEAALYNRVTGQFGKGALRELVYLYTVT